MRKTRKKAALVLLALLTAAQLNGCGGKETTETKAEGTASVQTTAHGDETGSGMETSAVDGGAGSAGTETSAADGQTAGEGETVAPEEVVEDWMVPITGDQVKDGEYDVEVKSSSSMFKITDCRLTVKDGEMTTANWPTARAVMQKNARYSSSREIPQAALPKLPETGCTRRSCRSVVRS